MPNLLEDPTPILFVGIAAEAVLGIILLRSGRGVILWAMAGALLLTLLGVGVSWLVVTERERVAATLDGVAAALEANDLQKVLGYVDPSGSETRARAKGAMERIEITRAKIRNLEITVNRLTSPPTARARFDGVLAFRDRKGESPYENFVGSFTVELSLKGDRWLITGHSEEDPRASRK